MSLPYPYYPDLRWPLERARQRTVVVVVIVVVIAATLAGWTPPEILRFMTLVFQGS
jgi:hypothetical protein